MLKDMSTTVRDESDLELALLRRSVAEGAREADRCRRCRRSPLIGERVYTFSTGATVCELCRPFEPTDPVDSRLVHGPAFGNTLRIIDRRSARVA
jgi:hypothetical protein